MKDTAALMADFFAQDDLARLTVDAGELLDCPLMVIDDAFRVTAHYAPPGFTDPLFDRAVQQGAITYEAGAIISRSPALSAGAPDYVEVADSTRRRRFAPLISAGVRLGYLVCVDIDGHLADIPAETFRTVETVLYRIHKMREDFAVPLDDPAAHTALLLSTALTLLDSKGAELFIDDPPGDDCEKD